MVWEWGRYLGDKATESGVEVCVSSWSRAAPNTYPTMAKVGGNYINSILIKLEAVVNGFTEGIALDSQGHVSEGSGENIFAIRGGQIYTPAAEYSILPGITRESTITIAGDFGISVEQRGIPREFLYIADEVFFTGTAAEISPIRAIDQVKIGNGTRGPITKQLQEMFFKIVNAEVDEHQDWLTFV